MRSLVATFKATQFSAFALFARAFTKRGWVTSFLLIGLSLAGGATVRGQSASDGFDPNPNGLIRVVVVQPDGKILIGGDFTTLSPNGGATVTRNRIARLNHDGTLDTAFNPNATDAVHTIALQADGKILAGGAFNGVNSIGGQNRNRLARLDANTGLADSFDPNVSGTVFSIAVQADGNILAGGAFAGANSIGGQSRNFIARLDANTGLADTFNPSSNGVVRTIVVQANGKILVGGQFNGANSIGGQTRNYIARLNAGTGLADSFDPNATERVVSIAVQPDGKIVVAGVFNGANSIGGQTRNYIARLDAVTGLADAFDPNANSDVRAIILQPDGKILVGGAFSGANSIGGQMRNFFARLDPVSGLADSFDPSPDGVVFSLGVQADGRVLATGGFSSLAPNGGLPVTRSVIARLETDGRLDQTLTNPSVVGTSVLATAVQPDGKILIGGTFTDVLGVMRNNIARLNTDGTLDTTFNPNANGTVNTIALQPDGKILVGGDFFGTNSIGGETRNYIARLDGASGAVDVSFDPDASGAVRALVVQADGKILAGGFFSTIGGQTRNRIARLDATTGLADSFDPNVNGTINALAVQSDGKVLAGGSFNGANSIGGQTRNHIARLDGATGLPDSFDPNANGTVFAITVQTNGNILVGGGFNGPNSIGGQGRNRIARLDANTGLADSFNPDVSGSSVFALAEQADGKILVGGTFFSVGVQPRFGFARIDGSSGLADSFDPNPNDTVFSIAAQTDGKILVGGEFSTIGIQTRSLFARLLNDTAALQNLTATPTSVTWTRSGSSMQFARVTFESSTDSVNYTLLGNGTAAGSNWTLTGLNLPSAQSLYIRARGYYQSGDRNGSESIAESVRNAFVGAPTAAGAHISGRILASDGTPIPGAIVYLSGTQTRKTITNEDGDYRFDNVNTSGFYTVTPHRVNYSFGPASRSFSQVGNATDASFTGTPNAVIVGNAIDAPEYFVRQHYLDFLGREPDEAGFNFWSDQILECGADTNCIERRRENVSAAYFLSIEFQQTGGLVDGIYRATFGRRPFYAEFIPDARTVAHDVVVGRSGWEQQLYLNKQAFVEAFVQRPAFHEACDNLSNENYVDTLIAHTLIAFTRSERDALVSDLAGGQATRAAVLLRIAEDGRFVSAKRNEAFVMMEYFGYLQRDPDESGYQFWLQKLNQFNGNFQQAEMVKAFIVSGEYRARFAQ